MTMTLTEKKEERGINAQIEALEENLELAQEKLREVEDSIAVWRKQQRPSQQDQTPSFQAEALSRAKQIIEKHKQRLEQHKAQLRDLHARVKSRLKAEKQAEKERAELLPKIAARLVEMVNETQSDDLSIIFALATARETASRIFSTVEKMAELETERQFLMSKGYKISELPELSLPVCADELKSAWRDAFGEAFEIKRTAASRKKAGVLSQMRGALRDAAAS